MVILLGDHGYSVRTLDALAAQTVAPDRVEVVASDSLPEQVEARLTQELAAGRIESITRVSSSASVASVFTGALYRCNCDTMWVLFSDSVPGPAALETLQRTMGEIPDSAVIGCTRRGRAGLPDGGTADDSRELVDVGFTTTMGGRLVTEVEPYEIDQGQLADRSDVLAVAFDGMLLDTEVARSMGGVDALLSDPWMAIDFCRRAWRFGKRVIVAPQARVIAREETVKAGSEQDRASQILERFKRRSTPGAILDLAFLPLLTLWHILFSIAAHRVGDAWLHARAFVTVLKRSPAVLVRSFHEAHRAKVSRPALRRLYLSGAKTRTLWWETFTESVWASDDRSVRRRLTRTGICNVVDERPIHGQNVQPVAGLIAVLFAAAISLVGLSPLVLSGKSVGGDYISAESLPDTAYASFATEWVPQGLGAAAAIDPLVRLIGLWPFTVHTSWLLLLALPFATWGAFLAAGMFTRSAPGRVLLALSYALSPPMLSSLMAGRWADALALTLLAWAAWSLARAMGRPPRRPSLSAAATCGLLLVPVIAAFPATVFALLLLSLVMLPFVPGRRLRLLWLFVPSLPLLVGNFSSWWENPRTLAASGAVLGTDTPARLREILLLWPQGMPQIASGAPLPQLLMLGGGMIPVAIFALVAVFLPRAAGSLARVSWVASALFMALALLTARTVVGVSDAGNLTGVPTVLLGFTMLGLLAAAAATIDTIRPYPSVTGRLQLLWRRAVRFTAAFLVAATGVVWAWQLVPLATSQAAQLAIPAASAHAQQLPEKQRSLVITVGQDGSLHASLYTGKKDAADVNADLAAKRIDGSWRVVGRSPEDAADKAFSSTVAALVGGRDEELEGALAQLNIGYVVVNGNVAGGQELGTRLDTVPALQKVALGENFGLWRVAKPSGYAQVEGAESPVIIPVSPGGIEARGKVEAHANERVVRVSTRADDGWYAYAGKTKLQPVTVAGWAQGFTLPAGVGGEVSIGRYETGATLTAFAAYLIWLVSVLVALPLRRSHEEDHA
ncbi:hypothetical protein ACUH89_04145 [Dermabacteraceae bacterium P13264]